MTQLAVAIMVGSPQAAHAQAAQAGEHGADLVEYRIDRFADESGAVGHLVSDSPLPCIVTCRPTSEGGEYEASDDLRLTWFEAAAEAGAAYLDVELAAMQQSGEFRSRIADVVAPPVGETGGRPKLILSVHDFDGRPADLLRRIRQMADDPLCHVIKVAWRARSLRDNLEAFELLRDRPKPMIALCMGEAGLPSRVLAGKFGALLTYAGLQDDTGTAPGQVGVGTMKSLYRWDTIDRNTAVYGVIGWPVSHSLSPALHNAGFDAVGHNGVYLPMPIPPEYEHFKATAATWLDGAELHFRGASVTIPHKQNLLRFVGDSGGEIEPLAQRIGAANTLTVRDDGSLYASNTDYAAALDSMCAAMGIERAELTGQRIAVIGAGGAARAIVAGLVHYRANVVIYNRTLERAQKLAAEFGGTHDAKVVAAPLDNLPKSCCAVYVNCTSVGMHPNVEDTPIPQPPDSWSGDTVVFDTIYTPAETRLLRDARAAGCRTVSGIDMFIAQAAAQFEQWTAHPAPRDRFRQILTDRLAT